MNAAQLTTNTKTTPQVTGRTLLLALGYGIGIAIPLGVLTGFGLRQFVPALSSADWLATIIATEVYLSLILGHVIAFGGFGRLQQRFHLTRVPWRHIELAFLVWLLVWLVAIAAYVLLRPVWGITDDMGQAILKIGSLYGRLHGASPALFAVAVIQPILLTPLFEELFYRGSLFGWLRGKLSAKLTILITSALFAVYHPLFLVWPIVFLFGLGAGWVRERTDSLTPFLVMHMLNSIAMIAAAYFITGWRV